MSGLGCTGKGVGGATGAGCSRLHDRRRLRCARRHHRKALRYVGHLVPTIDQALPEFAGLVAVSDVALVLLAGRPQLLEQGGRIAFRRRHGRARLRADRAVVSHPERTLQDARAAAAAAIEYAIAKVEFEPRYARPRADPVGVLSNEIGGERFRLVEAALLDQRDQHVRRILVVVFIDAGNFVSTAAISLRQLVDHETARPIAAGLEVDDRGGHAPTLLGRSHLAVSFYQQQPKV